MKKIMFAGLATVALAGSVSAQTPIISYDFETTPAIFQVQRAATATSDSSAIIYNYSAYSPSTSVTLPGGATTIPNAPGTVTKNALRLDVNHNDALAGFDGVNFYPTTQTLVKHTMEFDFWMNTHGPLASGSTEYIQFGASDGTRCEYPASPVVLGSSGFFCMLTGEGGATLDARYFQSDNQAAAHVSNSPQANWNGNNETDFGIPTVAAPGWANLFSPIGSGVNDYPTTAPGKQWNRLRMAVDGNVVRIFITPKNRPETAVSQFVTTGLGIASGSKPFVGYWDGFAGVANPVADQFALIDNLRVFIPAPAPNAAKDWVLYE